MSAKDLKLWRKNLKVPRYDLESLGAIGERKKKRSERR